jgi:hypothetical protein
MGRDIVKKGDKSGQKGTIPFSPFFCHFTRKIKNSSSGAVEIPNGKIPQKLE